MQRPFHWLSQQMQTLAEHLSQSRVAPDEQGSAQVHSFLAEHFDLGHQAPLDQVLELTSTLLRGWPSHGGHGGNFSSMAGDLHQVSLLGECLAHAWDALPRENRVVPLVTEIEAYCVDFLGARIGLKPEQRHGFFTADEREANQTAIVAGLSQCFPQFPQGGLRKIDGRPMIYVAEGCQERWLPKVISVGLGGESLRFVPCDSNGQLDVKVLRRTVIEDARQDHTPFLVVATAGNRQGAVDPLKGLAALTRVQGMWLHVDATMGGVGIFGPTMKEEFDGLRFADSISLDTRTAFAVAGSGGVFLCRHPQPLQAMQGASTYQRPLTHSAHALKVFVTLAHVGADGYADLIQHQCNMAGLLQQLLQAKSWRVQRPSSLPILLVTDPGLNPNSDQRGQYQSWVDSIRDQANTLLEVIRRSDGTAAIRICISNFATSQQMVEQLSKDLEQNRRI
jgi:glutamate/tyrosine decarboxylase-like PLP-dependent enzyme